MRSTKLRNFLVVATLPDNKVELVLQSPPEMMGNLAAVDRAVVRRWRTLAGQYRYPDYDVITARGENLEIVQKAFPELHGWQEAKTEDIEIELSHEAGGYSPG
jgi:hypothetical protein